LNASRSFEGLASFPSHGHSAPHGSADPAITKKVKEERERRVNRRATEAFRSGLAKPKSLDQIYKTYLALTR